MEEKKINNNIKSEEFDNMVNINKTKDNLNETGFKGKKRYSSEFKIKVKITTHSLYIKNPLITKFNKESKFIYDNNMAEDYLSRIKNNNLIKLKESEIQILKNKIKKYDFDKVLSKSNEIIYIDKSLSFELNNYFQNKSSNNELKNFLINEIKNKENDSNFTLRKLSVKYQKMTGKAASKSTIHNCLKKQLGFKYLKTHPKTNKILQKKNILLSLAFVKIIARCIKLNFHILYCDESFLQNRNNNYYCWRKPEENIFGLIGKRERLNLIMAIDENSVVYYEINSESTTEDKFYNFIQKLICEITSKKLYPCVLVLDNHSSHKTKKLKELYYNNNINVVFTTPYFSPLNAIELSFRNLKNYLNRQIFESINSLKREAEKHIEEKSFLLGIKSNYKETLEMYLNFHNNYNTLNLNNL